MTLLAAAELFVLAFAVIALLSSAAWSLVATGVLRAIGDWEAERRHTAVLLLAADVQPCRASGALRTRSQTGELRCLAMRGCLLFGLSTLDNNPSWSTHHGRAGRARTGAATPCRHLVGEVVHLGNPQLSDHLPAAFVAAHSR